MAIAAEIRPCRTDTSDATVLPVLLPGEWKESALSLLYPARYSSEGGMRALAALLWCLQVVSESARAAA